MVRRWLVRLFVLVGVCGLVPFVYAQSPSPVTTDEASLATAANILPRIYVTDLTATPGDNNTITGSFTIQNTEPQVLGDIRYEIVLLGPEEELAENVLVPEVTLVYDRVRQTETISLLPTSSKNLTFSYQPPRLPEGDYRVRIQITTSNDRELGWADAALHLGGAQSFALINDYFVEAYSTEVETGMERQEWAALEGVNVDPGQEVIVVGTLQPVGPAAIAATPRFSTRRILSATTSEVVETGPLLTIPAGAGATDVAFPLKAQAAAGSYRVALGLFNDANQLVSNRIEFQYVVRGASASVVSARLAHLDEKSATIDYTVVGPADRQTELAGRLEVALLDGVGVAGTTQQDIQLNVGSVSGTATVALDRAVEKPGMRLTITSSDGTVLDTYEVPFEGVSGEAILNATKGFAATHLKEFKYLSVGLALVVLAIVIVISIRYVRRRRPPSSGVAATMIVLLVIGAAGLLVRSADAVQYARWLYLNVENNRNDGGLPVTLFINSPVDGATTTSGQTRYEARVSFTACHNMLPVMRLTAYTKPGIAAPANQRTWLNTWPQFEPYRSYLEKASEYVAEQYRLGGYRAYSSINQNLLQLPTVQLAGWTMGLNLFKNAYEVIIQDNGDPFDGKANYSGVFRGNLPLETGTQTVWSRAVTAIFHTQASGRDQRSVSYTDDFRIVTRLTQCSDGKDNEDPEDKLADIRDPGCHTDGNPHNPDSYDKYDNDERNEARPQCSDRIDNDGDGRIDIRDPGCHTDANPNNPDSYDPRDNDERNPQCSDGEDNEDPEDTLADAADPGCHTDLNPRNRASYTPARNNEGNPQCSDLIDNDGDGLIDIRDPGCHTDRNPNNPDSYNPFDNNERNPVPQCSDGRDNADNEDDLADAADPGCHTDLNPANAASYDPTKNSESNPGLTCVPATQPVTTNQNAPLTVRIGTHPVPAATWSAPGGTPATGTGSSLTTKYTSTGAKTVTVTAHQLSSTCRVNVQAATTPTVSPTASPSGTPLPQCSDGIDNADPEDTLADAADPGCHTDKNPNNPDSYRPTRNTESDIDVGDFFEDDPS